MRLTFEDLHRRREEILSIARQHGAENVRVFGSIVRGESTTDSDLDLLVTMQSRRSLLDRIALMQDLEDLLGCKVDVVNERALHRVLRDRILAEGLPL
jgi:uncharacterized protein